jgi:hypothetical protein
MVSWLVGREGEREGRGETDKEKGRKREGQRVSERGREGRREGREGRRKRMEGGRERKRERVSEQGQDTPFKDTPSVTSSYQGHLHHLPRMPPNQEATNGFHWRHESPQDPISSQWLDPQPWSTPSTCMF